MRAPGKDTVPGALDAAKDGTVQRGAERVGVGAFGQNVQPFMPCGVN